MAEPYKMAELMVVAGSREIKDDDIIFVGMRLPLLAFQLAKETHAPNAVGIFEIGLLRDEPAQHPLFTMGDCPNIHGALWATDMLGMMALLQKGYISLGFIGGAEIDRYGNLNTSYIGDPKEPSVRLPGSGGASDIASLSKRLVIMMAHERRRFKEKVDYITSPGYGEGRDWREVKGIRGGGPCTVITTLGIFKFQEETKEMYLDSVHPGITIEDVKRNTGWDLKIGNPVKVTAPPNEEELAIIRKYDPQGFWTK